LEEAYAAQIKAIDDERNTAIALIKTQKQQIIARVEAGKKEIDALRDEYLRQKGISVETLNALRDQISKLNARIVDANSRRQYVFQYREGLERTLAQKPIMEAELQMATAGAARVKRDQDKTLKERTDAIAEKEAAIEAAKRMVDEHFGKHKSAKQQMELLAEWPMDQGVLDAGFDESISAQTLYAERTRGLLEDAGCTGRLDKHVWQSPVAEPCEFSLDIKQICDAN
jgi:hypothetical protein